MRFEHHEVHIVPKLCDGNLGVLQMLDYASGLDALREIAAVRTLSEAGTHLRDLVCHLLARTSEEILRRGPARDYVTREDALPAVRGRLLGDRQLLRRFGQLDRLECRYDEYEMRDRHTGQPGVGGRAGTGGPYRLRTRCTRARPPGGERLHSVVRPHAHYRQAHHWSLLLLRRNANPDLYAGGGGRAPVFLLDMNRLFEDFVARLVMNAIAGIEVRWRPSRTPR